MKHIVSVFLLLVVFWLGNSGLYKGLLLGLGLVSVLFVTYVVHRMDVVDHESQPLHLIGRKLPAFYMWLLVKLVQSNIDVVRRVWAGPASISPTQAWLPLEQGTDMGRVIYANSITLTPGTVAMELQGDRILVHALTRESIEELQSGEMHRRVAGLESSH